jgi:adenylylsulfate kinase
MIIQFCGMSGAGKTTLAEYVKVGLELQNIPIEILDADEYRKLLFKDLGFSKEDRVENIRRLAFLANKFSLQKIIPIICAINPYEEVRKEVKEKYPNVKTIFIHCPVSELIKRDTKGLYKKALLPEGHIDKIGNLTGINDPFEIPLKPDLVINTDHNNIEACTNILIKFIKKEIEIKK